MISYEGRFVCAECKPLFFQKVREGASVLGDVEYGGFWICFLAKFVDGIIMNIINQIALLLLSGVIKTRDPQLAMTPAILIPVLAVSVTLGAAYVIYFNGKFGATPGKMACRLRIVRSDGSPLGSGGRPADTSPSCSVKWLHPRHWLPHRGRR